MRKRKVKFRSSKLLKKRKRKIAFRVALYSVLIAGLIYGLSYLSSAEFLLIEKIEIVGNEMLKEKELRDSVEAEIQGKIFGLFSKRNIFLYPKRLIRTKLIEQFKRLASVDMDGEGLKILQVIIKEREAVAVWCQLEKLDELGKLEELEESKGQIDLSRECFFVDATGFIFDSFSTSTPNSFTRYEGKISSAVPVGSYFFGRADAKKVADFLTSLASLEVKVTKIIKEPERKVIITLSTGTDLILNFDNDWSRAFENLVTLASESEFKEYQGDNLFSPFTYIDLRFNNKLLYKLK